jgi:hypothetical protein
MIAKSLPLFSSDKTAHLPASVVPELELNGINPPPDTIEEVPPFLILIPSGQT